MFFPFRKKKGLQEKGKDSDDEGSMDTEASQRKQGGFMYKLRENISLSLFKRKKEAEIKDLQAKIDKRKWAFGDEYLRLAENGASRSELDKCVTKAQKEVKEMELEVQKKREEIEEKAKEVESNIQAAKEAKEAKNSRHGTGDVTKSIGETAEDPKTEKGQKKKKKLRGGADGGDNDASERNTPLDDDVEQPNKKTKKKKKRKSTEAPAGGAAAPATAVGSAAARASTTKSKASNNATSGPRSRPSYVPAAWKDNFNKQTRTDEPDPKRWKLKEQKFYGTAKYITRGVQQTWDHQSIKGNIEKFKRAPEKYVAIMFQTEMLEWDEEEQDCTVVFREGTVNWKPEGCDENGWMTVFTQNYERCKPFGNDEFPMGHRDKYTDDFKFKGKKIHSNKIKPVMPGRGMGVGDAPDLKVIGDVDPSDIFQGSVGDCWLLSGISALAEFDGAIKKLFRKTKNILNMPTDEPNLYTLTLWDLTTWKEVDIVIDERLCAHPDGKKLLLGAKPSEDGELWAPYIEKACAALAGGWDKLVGGQCTHAWSLLTGCKEQYTIMKQGDKFQCAGRFNTQTNEWAKHGNSPHDGDQGVWPMPWPEVGGGGEGPISKDELFLKMVAWDKENYIVAAGTDGESDSNTTGGMVDNHAYTVIASVHDVAGTGIDLLKVRNPWGKGEIEDGQFDDDGPGWDEYPQIKELLKPVVADDGIFWLTKEEFFDFFVTIYVSASDMTSFLEDTDHQYH